MLIRLWIAVITFVPLAAIARADVPRIVGHRGLMRHAPENTVAGFAACFHLRLGIELDIRRSKDGTLVLVHDDDVKRTTNGKGKVSDFTSAELRKLDAGSWFHSKFKNERVPTLDEILRLASLQPDALIALDIKFEDDKLAGEIVALAKKHKVLDNVVCIGLAIEDSKLRAKLKAADTKTPVAVLANERKDFSKALDEKNADWIYVRFLPTADEVKQVHSLKKRVFVVGKLVAGHEPENWRRAQDAGVDALLTDYPIECDLLLRQIKSR